MAPQEKARAHPADPPSHHSGGAEIAGNWPRAEEVDPSIVTVPGGIHGTFMYPQVRLDLVRCVDAGRWLAERARVRVPETSLIAPSEDRARRAGLADTRH
ncbi:MAG: hypothetical protein RJA99_483 [Pseudomonadota bacterium]|jgi:hypothetical protein